MRMPTGRPPCAIHFLVPLIGRSVGSNRVPISSPAQRWEDTGNQREQREHMTQREKQPKNRRRETLWVPKRSAQ